MTRLSGSSASRFSARVRVTAGVERLRPAQELVDPQLAGSGPGDELGAIEVAGQRAGSTPTRVRGYAGRSRRRRLDEGPQDEEAGLRGALERDAARERQAQAGQHEEDDQSRPHHFFSFLRSLPMHHGLGVGLDVLHQVAERLQRALELLERPRRAHPRLVGAAQRAVQLVEAPSGPLERCARSSARVSPASEPLRTLDLALDACRGACARRPGVLRASSRVGESSPMARSRLAEAPRAAPGPRSSSRRLWIDLAHVLQHLVERQLGELVEELLEPVPHLLQRGRRRGQLRVARVEAGEAAPARRAGSRTRCTSGR